MPAPYSLDLRERVVHAVEQGLSSSEVARRLNVSQRTVNRYTRQQLQTGTLVPAPNHGRPRSMTESEHLRTQLEQAPTATLAEHCASWAARSGQSVSIPTMWRAIRRLGWTRKKGRWQPGNATSRSGLPGGPRR